MKAIFFASFLLSSFILFTGNISKADNDIKKCKDLDLLTEKQGVVCETSQGTLFERIEKGVKILGSDFILSDPSPEFWSDSKYDIGHSANRYCKRQGQTPITPNELTMLLSKGLLEVYSSKDIWETNVDAYSPYTGHKAQYYSPSNSNVTFPDSVRILHRTSYSLTTHTICRWSPKLITDLSDDTPLPKFLNFYNDYDISSFSLGLEHSCSVVADHLQCNGKFGSIHFDDGGPSVPRKSILKLSAGGNNTCVIGNSQTVHCWGEGSSRYQEDRTGIAALPEDLMTPSSHVSDVSVGQNFACVVSFGKPICWGSRVPETPNIGSASKVAVGGYHACVIAKSGVECWGSNQHGQTQVPQLTNPSLLSAGTRHTCAQSDEGVKCWGNNDYGQSEAPGLNNVIQLSLSESHSCALTSGGVKCWGDVENWFDENYFVGNIQSIDTRPGEVCALVDGKIQCQRKPSVVVPPVKNFDIQLALGAGHGCMVNSKIGNFLEISGTDCWGHNDHGQVDAHPLGAQKVVTYDSHTCVLTYKGIMRCWGRNDFGQAELHEKFKPDFLKEEHELENEEPEKITDISVGISHTCALSKSSITCWGNNNHKQLEVPQSNNYYMISSGGDHNCAIGLDGIKCWGRNDHGQTIVPPLERPKAISSGENHNCAIYKGGIKCWGSNHFGQLDIPSLVRPTAVVSGAYHNCALDQSGVKCWGKNDYGQTSVPQLNKPYQIFAGSTQSCATDINGVTCWGKNSYTESLAEKIFFSPSYIGPNEGCARLSGKVKCWGENIEKFESNKKMLSKMSYLTQVTLSRDLACAVTGGRVKCWKYNPWFDPVDSTYHFDLSYYEQELVDKAPLQANFIVLEELTACASTNKGVKCWGEHASSLPKSGLWKEREVKQIVLAKSGESGCVLTNSGELSCTDLNPAESLGEPVLQVALNFNGRYGCIRTQTKVKCWGDDEQIKKENIEAVTSLPNPLNVIIAKSYVCVSNSNQTACSGSPGLESLKFDNFGKPESLIYNTPTDQFCAINDSGVECKKVRWGGDGPALVETNLVLSR